jgi:hypothetical protein
MKKFAAVVLLCLCLSASLSAAETAQQSLGFVFEMKNLLLSINPYDDGYQTGAGLKWWMMKNIALRGLLNFDLNIFNNVTTMDLGVSCGLEYHLTQSKASPYIGAFAGTRMTMAAVNAFDVYAGGMAGVEMRVWENVGAFVEYDLLLRLDAAGFTAGIGAGGGAQVGLIVYF